MDTIDLRSDTVTWPTPAMRAAIAEAPVGDDVYGDDPSVNALEALAARAVGKEAALFVPSGTFGNQLALFSWCPRGSEVILGEQCHIIQHEAGAASVIAGVQTRPVDAPAGVLPLGEIRSRVRGDDIHYPPTSLICLENAHSSGAGRAPLLHGRGRGLRPRRRPSHPPRRGAALQRRRLHGPRGGRDSRQCRLRDVLPLKRPLRPRRAPCSRGPRTSSPGRAANARSWAAACARRASWPPRASSP